MGTSGGHDCKSGMENISGSRFKEGIEDFRNGKREKIDSRKDCR